ncbi:helix-turn-helix domain-containing protein [Paenibacillus sp. FSL K6-3182]|uniref:helix-turn-helix domain-containing protein n=1 Tax=Paenibacillus sp. FSL K6-3182 TaxID=2921495 RepID=UPI0030D06ABA
MTQSLQDIGYRIREIRELRGLTLDECAKQSNITRAYLNTMELGQANFSIGKLQSLSNTLNVQLSDFFMKSPSLYSLEEEVIKILSANKNQRNLQCVIALLRAMDAS